MKTGTLVIALTLTATASMTGCAAEALSRLDPMLQRETAIAIGGNAVAPEQIKIADDQDVVGGGTVHWHASAPSGEFDCSAVKGIAVVTETVCVRR
jgi:hypothetical protein